MSKQSGEEAGPPPAQYKTVIDELARLRAAAEQLAQQWQATFDAAGDAIWILDAEQRVVRSNKAAEEVFGCPLADMADRRCFDIAHHTDSPIPGCPFCVMRVSRQRESFEMQLDQRWYLVTVDPMLDAEGNVTGAVHIARDITAHKQAEEQIRFQASLVENASDAIIATDLEYNVLSWNKAAEAIYGWRADEVRGQPLGKFLRTEFVNDTLESSAQAVREKGFWRGEVLQSRKDGATVPILASVTLFRDQKGNPQGLVAVNRDISERKEAERRIRESEETYRNLFHNAQVGLFRTRIADGKILESNEQLARMFGYESREEFIAEYATEQNYVDPGTRERMLHELQEHGEIRNFQARFYRKDRSIFWAQYSAKIYPDKGWIEGIAEDITARKEAEAQIHAAHAELQRLLDEAEQGRRTLLSVVEDQKAAEQALRENNRRLSLLNQLGLALAQTLDLPTIYRVACEFIAQLVDCPLFGVSRYDPATRTLYAEYMVEEGVLLDAACFPPLTLQPDAPITGRARAILTQQPEIVAMMPTPPTGHLTIVGQSDEAHIVRSALYVPIIVRGETTGLLEMQSYRENAYSEADAALLGPVANQIGLAIENARLFAALEAERNSLARRVRERTAELEAANKELEAFSYSVSHDLRAPLRALDGFGAALLSQYGAQLDEDGRHYLERVRAAAQRMDNLIRALLDLSRVTRQEMIRQPVALSALAREIAGELQAREPQRQVEFRIADGLTAEGDPHLLRIALENLLGNAWKFTGKRERAIVEFGVLDEETRGQEDKGTGEPPHTRPHSHTYFVRDNGVGFDPAYAGKLFAPFQRLHGTGEFPGTGIGLATVQRIIARHGGRVWAEAAVEQGATFYFTLDGDKGTPLHLRAPV